MARKTLTPVEQIFHLIPDLATPEQVQTSLRRILDDPSLELFWWDRESERYVDVHDSPGNLATGDGAGPRVATPIEYETRRVGAMLHDPKLLDRHDFLEAFVPAMRIAMERDRLHHDLLLKIEQLKASRLRIVEAADGERRRLERNLHDGAQQRLVVVLLALRALEARIREDPELEPVVRSAKEELEGAIDDLRELARGLHPPLLAQQGLEAALRAGAARSTVPVELDLRLEGGLPPAVEAAAYYVCAEAATNAIKHAHCALVRMSVVHAPGALTVEVRDDGIGGASIGEGSASGLCGLRDRVEALDGTLLVESPVGAGTRLVAVFPV